jgi:DNA-binding CsgD family transcriptional regulator
LKVTDRQKDIIHLSAKGKSREEIGKEIGISPDGVFRQEKKIMAKMGAAHLGEFYRYIVRAGLEFIRKPGDKPDNR